MDIVFQAPHSTPTARKPRTPEFISVVLNGVERSRKTWIPPSPPAASCQAAEKPPGPADAPGRSRLHSLPKRPREVAGSEVTYGTGAPRWYSPSGMEKRPPVRAPAVFRSNSSLKLCATRIHHASGPPRFHRHCVFRDVVGLAECRGQRSGRAGLQRQRFHRLENAKRQSGEPKTGRLSLM